MFENPMMLAALGGAVVPLVIHLLGRARYRSLEWGAMMFIDAAAAPRFRDPGRFREWMLLAVRMAAVSLLAIALARPVMDTMSAIAPGSADPRVAAAIVVDCSASMGYEDVAGPRIEQGAACGPADSVDDEARRPGRAVRLRARRNAGRTLGRSAIGRCEGE
jgi:hypothetical protein